MEEKREQKLTLTARNALAITGVRHVDSFDNHHIVLNTELGGLLIRGHDLKIQQLDLDTGEFEASGEIDALLYHQRVKSSQTSGWKKLWG